MTTSRVTLLYRHGLTKLAHLFFSMYIYFFTAAIFDNSILSMSILYNSVLVDAFFFCTYHGNKISVLTSRVVLKPWEFNALSVGRLQRARSYVTVFSFLILVNQHLFLNKQPSSLECRIVHFLNLPK